jgi:hypothetical protein
LKYGMLVKNWNFLMLLTLLASLDTFIEDKLRKVDNRVRSRDHKLFSYFFLCV